MTTNAALIDVVGRTRTLLLDFDGPVCSIFAGYPAPNVAAYLRDLLLREGVTATTEIEATDDPIQVLRLSAAYGDDKLNRTIADGLRDAEVLAAQTAQPTAHADEVIRAALNTGRRLAVVSNNSVEAVTAYLRRQGLDSSFGQVVGRYANMTIDLMKPSNHLISLAMSGMDATPSSTTLVGDMTSDIEAARSVPIACIGYANWSASAESLAEMGADALIETMADLAEALSATPVAN